MPVVHLMTNQNQAFIGALEYKTMFHDKTLPFEKKGTDNFAHGLLIQETGSAKGKVSLWFPRMPVKDKPPANQDKDLTHCTQGKPNTSIWNLKPTLKKLQRVTEHDTQKPLSKQSV